AEHLLLGQILTAGDRWRAKIVCVDEPGSLRGMYQHANLEVESVGTGRRATFSVLNKLRSVIREWAPDLVHMHLPRSGFYGRIACRAFDGLPVVYTEHNVWEVYPVVTRWMNRYAYSR